MPRTLAIVTHVVQTQQTKVKQTKRKSGSRNNKETKFQMQAKQHIKQIHSDTVGHTKWNTTEALLMYEAAKHLKRENNQAVHLTQAVP